MAGSVHGVVRSLHISAVNSLSNTASSRMGQKSVLTGIGGRTQTLQPEQVQGQQQQQLQRLALLLALSWMVCSKVRRGVCFSILLQYAES